MTFAFLVIVVENECFNSLLTKSKQKSSQRGTNSYQSSKSGPRNYLSCLAWWHIIRNSAICWPQSVQMTCAEAAKASTASPSPQLFNLRIPTWLRWGKVERSFSFRQIGTHWRAATLNEKLRNRSGLNNWLSCGISHFEEVKLILLQAGMVIIEIAFGSVSITIRCWLLCLYKVNVSCSHSFILFLQKFMMRHDLGSHCLAHLLTWFTPASNVLALSCDCSLVSQRGGICAPRGKFRRFSSDLFA